MPSGCPGYVRTLEHAPLRPLPSRPSRAADPKLARTYVGARLPQLDAEAVDALALVELSQVERGQAARELGLSDEQMGAALARGRKALRRSGHALAGSGWCERAERMISDRFDGELASPARERLSAHLRNCPRCVEHELRLTQALDALVDGMPAPAKRAAAVRLVVPTVRALPPGNAPEELEEAPEAPPIEPPAAEPPIQPPAAEPALERPPETPPLEPVPEEPALDPPPEAPPLKPVREEPAIVPPPEVPPLEPAAAGPAPPPAPRHRPPPAPARGPELAPRPPAASPSPPVAPRPLADPRPVSALIVAFTWHIAFAVAVLLAVATVAVAALGIGGGSL